MSQSEFRFTVPYEDELAETEDGVRILRWISPSEASNHWKTEGTAVRLTSNLWNPIGAKTAHRLGFEQPAVSVHREDDLVAAGTSVFEQAHADADSNGSPTPFGIAFITAAQLKTVQGVGVMWDRSASPGHGILFRVGAIGKQKLSGSMRNQLSAFAQNQILRLPC